MRQSSFTAASRSTGRPRPRPPPPPGSAPARPHPNAGSPASTWRRWHRSRPPPFPPSGPPRARARAGRQTEHRSTRQVHDQRAIRKRAPEPAGYGHVDHKPQYRAKSAEHDHANPDRRIHGSILDNSTVDTLTLTRPQLDHGAKRLQLHAVARACQRGLSRSSITRLRIHC